MLSSADANGSLRRLSLSYNNADSQASALRLILALFPDWANSEGEIEFIRFTDGITNTLLKAVKKRPGYSEEQVDSEAVLLRAYGKGTEVLIDRERETTSHSLLSEHGLAPPLLARFQNGLIYRFIRGRVCSPEDLTQEAVWKGVARKLAEWHAVLPIVSVETTATRADDGIENLARFPSSLKYIPSLAEINAITPVMHTPNIWTVMQKWIFALPDNNDSQRKRNTALQQELRRSVKELSAASGLGEKGLVLGHCDLLSGNVIIQPSSGTDHTSPSVEDVSFIDYEYATPAPAAFDIANHFAEWGGFDCDYNLLPTRSIRRGFILEYLHSYFSLSKSHDSQTDLEPEADQLFEEVDRFRGIPGFYWGIWALIQATISQIDFDYAAYAEVRLGEYWDWRAEEDGSRQREGKDKGLRETRWAEK